MRAALLVLPLTLCAACLRQIEFRCSADSQCAPGLCQTAVGYCSFSDSACSSGQRFGELAGPYAELCVDDFPMPPDAGVDASPDGPPVGCPGNFTTMTGGNPGHLYRASLNNMVWLDQDNFCKALSPRAYLAVPDDAAELTSLHMRAGGTFWVGVSDRVTEGVFIQSIGGAATFLPWAAGEPDDAGSGQDCVRADATTFSDDNCSASRQAVCECAP
jgi:hypothetical protein